jgi:hypothetical protein
VQHILLLFCLSQIPLDGCPQMIAEMQEMEGPGIVVHRPDGHTVYLNPRYIRVIREPISTEQSKGVNATIVFNSGATQFTQETVDEINLLIAKEKQLEKRGYDGGP